MEFCSITALSKRGPLLSGDALPRYLSLALVCADALPKVEHGASSWGSVNGTMQAAERIYLS